jgi:hypothetical protein
MCLCCGCVWSALTKHFDATYVIDKVGIYEVAERSHRYPAALDEKLLDGAEPQTSIQQRAIV